MSYSICMKNDAIELKAVAIDNRPRRIAKVITVAAFLLASLFVFTATSGAQSSSRSAALSLQNAFREVSAEVLPVVVQVNTVNVIERQGSSINPFDFFFRFPNSPEREEEPEVQEYRQQGLGSGVLVERRGHTVYVLTNNHVVQDADEIEVNLNDGRSYTAELVGGDPLRDLALVSFESKEDIPLARLGDSDEVWVGDWALAIGNPLGFESTVTAGIISAKGRHTDGQAFTDYLQTDASINRGNSGGALVNLDGEVIGINTFIASNSGGNIGLGFAIPINNARQAIDDFIETGMVQYAWLGVNMGDVNDNLSDEMDLDGRDGAFIFNVYGDSPAMNAGIHPGDLIIRVGGKSIKNSDDLSSAVASLSPGQTVSVGLFRDGRTMNISLTLAVRTIETDGMKTTIWPGFSAVPITSELREQMRIPRNAGDVLIGGVVQDSAAAALGLRSGDVIKSINRRNVKDLQHFYELVNSEDRLELKIVRQGHELEYILNK